MNRGGSDPSAAVAGGRAEADPVRSELAVRTASGPGDPLPIRSEELFGGMSPRRTLDLERAHGNSELIRVMEALGIAGPLKRLSPWELEDPSGRHLVHAGGYAALPFGEAHPELVDFTLRYLRSIDRNSFHQQTASDARAALATNLVALLASVAPSHADSRVVFSNSGAESIELAIKMARAGRPKGTWILSFRGGYHGKTLGALSVTPTEEYQAPFRPLLPHVRVLPYGDAEALEGELFALGPDSVAAILLEPVQGEGGVIVPPEDFLPAVEALRQRHGVPVIADEIQTGLGRTGHWFASVAAGLQPDIVTLAKPLSGGLMPIGATIARKGFVAAMLPGLSARRHSSTFAGNNLAMAVGIRALEMLVDGRMDERARRDGAAGLTRLRALAERYPGLVKEARGAGMLLALRLRHTVHPRLLAGHEPLAAAFGSGLGIRGLHLAGVHANVSAGANGTLRFTPALNMPEDLQEELWRRVERFAARTPQAWRLVARTPPDRLARLLALARRGGPTR